MTLDCTKFTSNQKTWLKKGSKGSQVTELQKLLQQHGYYKGYKVDGVFGQKTKDAVISFQKAKKQATHNGNVGPTTCKALNNVTEKSKVVGFDCPNTSLKRDQSNNADLVKKLQQGLQSIGYYKGYKVDGSYGTYTANAVAAFQRANGLSPDGWFGPKTCAVFNQKLGWSDAKSSSTKTTTTVTKKKATEIQIDTKKANFISASNPEINFIIDGVYFIATDITDTRSFENEDWQTLELMGNKTYTYPGHTQPREYDVVVNLHKDDLAQVTTALQQMSRKVCDISGKSITPGKYVLTVTKSLSVGDWRTLTFHLLQYRV